MDEDDLLSGQSVSSEQRTHEVIQALLSDRPLDYFTEEDVTLVENAVKKIQTGLEVAKKNILTDEDILGVSGIQMQSAPSSMSISRTSASTSNSVSDESQMEFDLDLDYDEYISEAQLPDDPREGSVTPRNMSNGSVICLSSDSGSSYSHKIKNPKNLPNIVFSRKLNRENQYLKLKKLKPPVDISKLDFVYPLGVTFDRESSTWFVADKMKNSVVKIYSGSDRRGRGYCEMKGPYLNNPTAITVLKEGSKVAILCAEAACKPVIRLLDIRSEGSGSITEFCSWKNECLDFNYQARGLARSLGGNLLTTDRPFKGSPRLRVFTKSHRHKTYVLESAELPSFIASSGSTVVITDLGKEQTVLHCRLDDSDFDRTSFQVLRTISTTGVNLKAHEMINKQYFMYVAGAQIDRNGNILIADARNRHFKLFKPSMGFIHRVSTDFPVPYVSSFHVNEDGEMLILSTRNEKVSFARLTATNRLEPHIAGAIGQRPAEKSIFSKRLHRTHSRESIRSMIKLNRRVLLGLLLFLTGIVIYRVVLDETSEHRNTTKKEVSKDFTDVKCYYDNTCALPQMLFRIQTETDNAPPFACLNDIELFDTANIVRGINAAILNGTTGDILEKATFDVTASDEKLMKWLLKVPHAALVVAASFGDVAEHVSRQARQLFSAFGATKIDEWRGQSAYAIIGQRGIKKGEAHEVISGFTSVGREKLFEGCFELPIAETKDVDLKIEGPSVHRADETKLAELGAFEADLLQNRDIEYGDDFKNCGLENACNEDAISVYFFSGEHKDDHPRMCVNGKILFDKDLNGAGRGLNLAMLEPKTGRVRAVAHFDTYEDESHGLEEWLDAVPTGYIVAVVSFDEASNMLSDMARRIFYEMGSSMIDRLKFRASWYFVGQKGIGAYTPFEDLNIPQGNNWANPIKTSFCLPKSLYKWAGRKDLSSAADVRNLPKRHFCAKYDRHETFCNAYNLDVPIMPRLLRDDQKANDAIFNVPILVASGLAPDSLRATLESLLDQEGLNTQMVLVTYDKEYSENADLASLFHVKSVAITSNGSYNELLRLSLDNAFSVFPDASSIIVIEEDVTLSSDWLQYFSSIYEAYKADNNVDIALSFNSNGWADTSGDGNTIYRIKGHLPMGSYLMKRELYEKHIRLREFCCTERGNWDLRESVTLVPALSRIRRRVDELEKRDPLFNGTRISSTRVHSINSDYKTKEDYNSHLTELVKNTKKITHITDLLESGCEKFRSRVPKENKTYLVTYVSTFEVEKVFTCLNLYITQKILRNNRVFRFALYQTTEVVFVPESLKIV